MVLQHWKGFGEFCFFQVSLYDLAWICVFLIFMIYEFGDMPHVAIIFAIHRQCFVELSTLISGLNLKDDVFIQLIMINIKSKSFQAAI